MKNFLVIFLMLWFSFSASQGIDTLRIAYPRKNVHKVVLDSMKVRYNRILQFYPEIKKDFPFDKLKFYDIPVFSINKEKIHKYKCGDNFAQYLDFKVNYDNINIIIESSNKIVGHAFMKYFFLTSERNLNDKLNLPELGDYDFIRSDGADFNRFRLEKQYFTFRIKDVGLVCILDNNKIYVIQKLFYSKSFMKIPLDIFIRNKFGQRGIRNFYRSKRRFNTARFKKCSNLNSDLFIFLDEID